MATILKIGLKGLVLPQVAVALARSYKLVIVAPSELELSRVNQSIINASTNDNPYSLLPNISFFMDTRRLDSCHAVL